MVAFQLRVTHGGCGVVLANVLDGRRTGASPGSGRDFPVGQACPGLEKAIVVSQLLTPLAVTGY